MHAQPLRNRISDVDASRITSIPRFPPFLRDSVRSVFGSVSAEHQLPPFNRAFNARHSTFDWNEFPALSLFQIMVRDRTDSHRSIRHHGAELKSGRRYVATQKGRGAVNAQKQSLKSQITLTAGIATNNK
ncbi:hypothetical protein Bmul_1959 [Burkholderia multivorans ATCC 17616]|nr:hypothetical protein Bmul_1959 [Burkholderia multivorans ATCC 17616]